MVQGIIPGVILIVFLGIFGLYTAKLLIDFKLNHPEVHNMGKLSVLISSIKRSNLALGDAGAIIFGPVGREILSFGTVVFAIFATVSSSWI